MTTRLALHRRRLQIAFAIALAILLHGRVSVANAQPDVTNPQTAASIIDSIGRSAEAELPPELQGLPTEELSIGSQIWQVHRLANDFFDEEPSSFDSTMSFVEPEDAWMGTVLYEGQPVATVFLKQQSSSNLDWFVSSYWGSDVGLSVSHNYENGDKLVTPDIAADGMYLLRGLDLIGVDAASEVACPSPCTLSQYWNVYHDPVFSQATQMASLPPLTQDQLATAEVEGANAATLQAAGFKIETPAPLAMSPDAEEDSMFAHENGALDDRGGVLLLALGGLLVLAVVLAAARRAK